MQIKLTPDNERLIEEYRSRTPSAFSTWHPSPTAIANNAIKEWMEVKAYWREARQCEDKAVLGPVIDQPKPEGKP